jgi:15-cis-phytoene synthase
MTSPAAVESPRQAARDVLAKNSKSFALAARLLPADVASDVFVLYAYCRHVDDAVDMTPPAYQLTRLVGLRSELDEVFADASPKDARLGAFQRVVRDRGIPRVYLDELLAGMAMDVENVAYREFPQLALYAQRVAGVVGLMMCHVMGVRRQAALENAAHLGIGMQLTNIARDVHEDWQRGRLYLSDDLLAEQGVGELRAQLGRPLPADAVGGVARATAVLLSRADAYYASGDRGVRDLSLRCGLAVRSARHIYSAIGDRVRAQGCDPLAGRAVVSGGRKLSLVAVSMVETLCASPSALVAPAPAAPSGEFVVDRLVL